MSAPTLDGRKYRYWTTAELREFRELYPHTLTAKLCARFGRSRSALKNLARKMGLHKWPEFVREHHRFQTKHATWNKGKAWSPPRSDATQFKKGHRRGRYRPVGSERRERDGMYVKVAAPDVWKPLARVVWEKNFGPIPAGAIVRLKEAANFSPENLMLVTRAEHIRLNWRPRGPAKKDLRWIAPLKLAA